MKILIIPSWYPTKDNEVVGSFFHEQAFALKKHGHDVAVFCVRIVPSRKMKECRLYTLTKQCYKDIVLFEIYVPSFGSYKLHNTCERTYVGIRIGLQKVIRMFGRPDVIHAHSFSGAGYAITKICRSIPIVVTEHSSIITQNKLNEKEKKQLRFTVDKSKFLAVSQYLANCITDIIGYNDNIEIVPNMIDNRFTIGTQVKSNDDFVFCTVSNLFKIKNLDLLIDAFCEAFNNTESVFLRIAGEGPERDRLEQKVKKLGISSRVSFLGKMSREEVLKLYQSSDAFVMVSNSETFGVAYVEALACGLPTIGTMNGGANEILKNYGSISIEVGSREQLVEKMIYVVKNASKYDRKKISNNILSQYSENVVVRKLENIYDSLVCVSK